MKHSTKYSIEERSRTSRLGRQDEMSVHEKDARRIIIDLGKSNFSSPRSLFLNIFEIC
jgi:hypothetical protein